MTLPAYRPDATCPKCGHDVVDTAYLANGREYVCSCRLLCGERSEHLHRRCQRCTFTWPEAVIERCGRCFVGAGPLCEPCQEQVAEEAPAAKMSALPRPAADTGEGGSVAASALSGPLAEARP